MTWWDLFLLAAGFSLGWIALYIIAIGVFTGGFRNWMGP
jgi:hypothetical protein